MRPMDVSKGVEKWKLVVGYISSLVRDEVEFDLVAGHLLVLPLMRMV